MDEKEPKQQTEQGHEIPVPKRSAWDRLLRKVAQPKPANGDRASEGAQRKPSPDHNQDA
jgi:hypothetical protein